MRAFFKYSKSLVRFYSESNATYDCSTDISRKPPHQKRTILKTCKPEYLFGLNSVHVALKSKKRSFYELFIENYITQFLDPSSNERLSEIRNLAASLDIPITYKNKAPMNQITRQISHQGVILKCSSLPMPEFDSVCLSDLSSMSPGIILFLDEIKDIMNFSHLLKNCAFFGVIMVLLPLSSSCSPRPIISNISLGAMEAIPIVGVTDKVAALRALKSIDCRIVGTSGNATVAGMATRNVGECSAVDTGAVRGGRHRVLVIGREDLGITGDVGALCDLVLRVPHVRRGECRVNSLNVAVATGVVLHFLRGVYQ